MNRNFFQNLSECMRLKKEQEKAHTYLYVLARRVIGHDDTRQMQYQQADAAHFSFDGTLSQK